MSYWSNRPQSDVTLRRRHLHVGDGIGGICDSALRMIEIDFESNIVHVHRHHRRPTRLDTVFQKLPD